MAGGRKPIHPKILCPLAKKCTSYKVEIVFYSEDLLRAKAEEVRASQTVLRHCSKEIKESGYIGFFDWKKKKKLTTKVY